MQLLIFLLIVPFAYDCDGRADLKPKVRTPLCLSVYFNFIIIMFSTQLNDLKGMSVFTKAYESLEVSVDIANTKVLCQPPPC